VNLSLFVISDLHLGGAPEHGDKPSFQMCSPIARTRLAEFIEYISTQRAADRAVQLVINGIAVHEVKLLADGTPRSSKFKTPIARSSWVALRIFPSAHTHPVFVQVGSKPIRASKRSAQWCRDCVDKVWEVKSPFMRESERPAAAEAFDHARKTYDTIIAECEAE